jgi:hypothetical protein
MVLNVITIVNGEDGKIFKEDVMANSNVTSQASFWVTAKGLLNLPAFGLRTLPTASRMRCTLYNH